jgi:hypothetical protein
LRLLTWRPARVGSDPLDGSSIHQPRAADDNGDGWLSRRDLSSDTSGAFGLGAMFRRNVPEP